MLERIETCRTAIFDKTDTLTYGWIRRRTRFSEASVWIGIVGVFLLVGLTVWEAVVEH